MHLALIYSFLFIRFFHTPGITLVKYQVAGTCCRQSKMLMRSPLPNRAKELLAVSKLRLRAAVGLLTDHTSLRTHLYKLGHTERQECRLCGYDTEDSVHTVCDCPVLACKRYRV